MVTNDYIADGSDGMVIFLKNKLGKQIIVNQAWWGGMEVGNIDFVSER